jgi:non-homologous end joining protein Ku
LRYFPASSEREKISFHQINKKTGNRIKYRKVDAETGDEVDSAAGRRSRPTGICGHSRGDP